MKKGSTRALKELYDSTEMITEPEITPVLEGNCRIQGPVDESDHELRGTNSGLFPSERKLTFTDSSPHMRIESGTCNMCSAPCSSCMHNNRTALAMESKMECGSSRFSCATKEDDNYSFIYADRMPHCKSRICDDLEHTASEASNFLSSSSSHDSYSECTESKASMKALDTCEAPENVETPPVPLRETGKDQFLQDKRSSAGFCLVSSNSHDTPDSCHGDNISCISGIKDSNLDVGTCNTDQKNATRSSASAHMLLSKEVEDTVQIEATDNLHGSEIKQQQSNYNRLAMHREESFQNGEYSVKASFSDKSKVEEVHMLKHITSPKVQYPCSASQHEHVFSHNAFKNSDGSPSCQLLVDGGESSLGSQAAVASSLGEKETLSKHEHSKAGYTGNVFSADSVRVTDSFLGNEHVLDKGISSNEVWMTSSMNREFEMPTSVDVSNAQEPQQVMDSENSESETELLDVKVCDICGDAGREEKLAFCSRCSDGAEHIYCMRKMRREVPKGDWLCEECQLKEDAERSKEIEMVPGAAKEFRLKDSCEIEKVDRSEMLSPMAKEYKLKEYTKGTDWCRSEAVLGTSRERKEDNGSKKVKVDRLEKLSSTAEAVKLKEYTEGRKGSRSEAVPRTSRECKEEESGCKKFNTSQNIPKTSKLLCLNETSQKFSSTSGSKHPSKLDMKAVDPDIGRVHKVLQSPRFSAKRLAESQDSECIEMGSPRKKPALSRETSFKNLDALKTKVAIMPGTTESRGANSPKGFSRSQSMLGSHSLKDTAKLQSPHGFISRSSSFNLSSKPKVKQLTESVPLKPKISRGSSFSDMKKEALGRSMTKSASFKNIKSGRSRSESASKVQFIHQSGVADPKSLKQMKEGHTMEKKRSIHNGPSTILSPRSRTSMTLAKMDMKTAGHDMKLNMSESNVARMSKGSESVNGLGRNEAKRQTSSSKVPGSVSLNAMVNNEDQRQSPDEGARERSSATDKSCNNTETVQDCSVLHNAEPTHQDDKTKESVLSNSRQSVSAGNQILRCQRCNEVGHTTQFCSINKLRSSAVKPSTDKNSKDGNGEDNNRKETETDIPKSKLQKNNIQIAQSKELAILDANHSCEEASKDFVSSSTAHPRDITFEPGTSNEQDISRRSEADCVKTAHASDVMLQPCPLFEASCDSRAALIIETSCSPKDCDLNASDAISVELNTRHLLHVLPDQASLLAALSRTPTIPELEFIWQGSLEVRRPGNESVAFDGIQAHLSTSSSPRVLEVANKMTCKVQLEEVPSSSLWQLQSREIIPNEHNIALFFFAKDVDSYERSYSKLLEKMLKNDLSLRGNIDDNELLIFPSTKLPVHSQRWNRLFFLWGIFKRSSINGLKSKMSPQKEASRPLNMNHATQDLPPALTSLVSSSQEAVSIENSEKSPRGNISPEDKACKMSPWKEAFGSILNMDHATRNPPVLSFFPSSSQKAISIENSEKSPRGDISPEAKVLRSATSVEAWDNSSSKIEDRMFKVQESPLVHNSSFQGASGIKPQLEQSSHAFPVSHFLSSTNKLSNLSNPHPESRFQKTGTPCCSEVKNDDAYLKKIGYGFEGRQAVTSTSHTHAINEQVWLSRASVSYSTPDCSEDVESSRSGKRLGEEEISMEEKPNRKRSHVSSTNLISVDINETMVSNDERKQKRICYGEETSSMRSSSKVHPLSGIWNQQSTESLNFFPVEPSPVQNNTKPENLIHILSSDDEDDQETKNPNLELALWGRQNAHKGRQWKNLDEDEDVSASLSLSLAVPTLEKERPKHVTNQDQERPDVSTSLLLFGRVINK
ncbi:uncharacterized protein A4U43_C10F3500 [Asparagus officinalis]|uniref:PHD-type domain-containing protein n=1 Tax=Asparagus officinalis TaxID=4686 RepID=A0A5P1E0M3_ASPOF|nr:uncharacterized protein LOC109825911 [Asparagus officinalis]ONK56038.1 uncharacterized protein A4U43_C10F3500 [Asparagus officinalis]